MMLLLPKKVIAFLVLNVWVIGCPLKGGPVAVILLLLLKKGTSS